MINNINDPIRKVIEMLSKHCKRDCNKCLYLIENECPLNILDDFWGKYHGYFIDDYKE